MLLPITMLNQIYYVSVSFIANNMAHQHTHQNGCHCNIQAKTYFSQQIFSSLQMTHCNSGAL